METEKQNFQISCPNCGNSRSIGIPKSLFSDKQFGSIKIQVPLDAVCPVHEFIVFLSNKGKIIGYDLIDASASYTEIEKEVDKIESTFSLFSIIRKLGYSCIAGFLHSKIFDYPSFIIRDNESDIDMKKLNRTFDAILPVNLINGNQIQNIQYDNYVFPNPDYFYTVTRNKKKEAYLVNNRRVIIHTPWNGSIDYEKKILEYSLNHEKDEEEKKFLTHYINEFLSSVDFTKKILEDLKTIKEKELIKLLKEEFIVSTIDKNRISLIKEFLERRVSPDLAAKIKL